MTDKEPRGSERGSARWSAAVPECPPGPCDVGEPVPVPGDASDEGAKKDPEMGGGVCTKGGGLAALRRYRLPEAADFERARIAARFVIVGRKGRKDVNRARGVIRLPAK